MKIGVTFFPLSPKFLVPLARLADEVGFESMWLGEHVAIPQKIEAEHPYSEGLGPPLPSTPLIDPLILIGHLAATTKSIRFGTGVFLLALRHPIMAARLTATADILSGGRLMLGVGVGWLKEEFDVQDIPWAQRGARLDENVAVLRRLWTEPLVEHHGRFYDFAAIGSEPKPAQGAIPVHIGGETPIALRRAAQTGDGWYGVTHTPDSAKARVRELIDMRSRPEPLEITVTSEALPKLDELHRFEDAGVNRVVFNGRLLSHGGKTIEAMLDGVSRFGDEIIHKLA